MAPALLAISFNGAASLLLFQPLLARLARRPRGASFGLLDQRLGQHPLEAGDGRGSILPLAARLMDVDVEQPAPVET